MDGYDTIRARIDRAQANAKGDCFNLAEDPEACSLIVHSTRATAEKENTLETWARYHIVLSDYESLFGPLPQTQP